ncbi:chromosome partitioning protein ParB [Leptospira mayottensis]|uniref:chromosome partitioning protein ParB n=1 Tax=Leptospira mayottensis TaxID=1137606 RepID=UPI000E35AEA0|nr:chromosome partitioning protein ParB [Leptospira mayottensis]AXR66860.1 chromosome partitioning protein ParB [Leptospira mayottensis]AXR66877.1 chromosome partitioning protein ParB [Leptospira mayottensis]
MKVEGNAKGPKKETSAKVSLEEKAKEWMEAQESTPRPGSSNAKTYIPKGVTLNPIVKMVKPESLRPNPRNDFERLSEEEYASLKENIALNGILDALTAKKDGTLVTGENRYRIALELKEHEDENVRRRVESIPVRYYMNELNAEEEYDILEGDNLFRRHLTAEQKKERLKRRILRKYKDDLLQDNRGGDRKSESSHSLVENTEEETNGEGSSDSEMLSEEESNNGPHRLIEDEEQKRNTSSSPEGQTELGLFFGEVGTLEEQAQGTRQKSEGLKTGPDKKSKDQGDLLIGNSSKDLAKKISENENIPFGSAKRYVTELKRELKSKDPKVSTKKEKPAKKKDEEKKTPKQIAQAKAKEFQKKYGKMSRNQKAISVNRLIERLVELRRKRSRLNEQISELDWKDHEIVTQLTAVGEKKRVWEVSK